MADATQPRSIEERTERITEIDARIGELDAEFAGTVMSDEAREEWNSLNAERDEHEAAVREMTARRERLRSLAQNPANTERASTDVPSFVPRRGAEIYDLSRIRADARTEDDYRASLHDNARRAVERAHFPASAGTREKVQEHVEDLLARLDDRHGTLAKRILVTGSPTYDRAFGKALLRGLISLSAEEQRAMSLGGGDPVGEEGGFAVPFQLDPTVILTNDGSVSPLRQIARVEQIVGKEWQGITSSGVTVSRSGEGDQAADDSFTLEQPSVVPTRVIADVRFSVEIDQDWPQMRSEITRVLADAKDREEDTSFVTGTGEGNNPSGVVSTLAAGSEVPLAGAGVLTLEDLLNLEAEVPVRFRGRGRFMANKSFYQAARALGSDSDGAELWVRLAGGQPPELLGYSAHEASAMQELGDEDGRVLLFGDFQHFIIVDRLGMSVEINPHIVGANGRWTGQRAVVAVWRNSSKILVHNAFRVLVDPTSA